MGIYMVHPGLLTTIQDNGRFGYQAFGVPPSGVMDERAFHIANLLVGNDKNEAVIEATMMGPEIYFEEDNLIAVTGAEATPYLNGRSMTRYYAFLAKKGEVLTFGPRKSGCRIYIAFHGGLDIEPVMGSCSTYLRGKFGGFCGRCLEKGDRIAFKNPQKSLEGYGFRFTEKESYPANEVTLRVVMGPQDHMFTQKGIHRFLTSSYEILADSDRMGYRLQGEKIEHAVDGNIISDGIAFGAVQVPTNGQPIVMMADRQGVGGYTKIANVISVDLPVLAQCIPGMKVRFCQVSLEEAQKLYCARLKEYEELSVRLDYPKVDGRIVITRRENDAEQN